VRVLVNDRADVALAAGADGVHLRSDSAAASRVRALSADWILGQSVHAADGAPTGAGADYLLFGPVFETDSKPGLPAAGLRALAAVASGAAVPVFAIGGLTADRAAACVRHGARGIAAIGLFLPEGATPEALGPAGAVRALRQALSAER
jgi:thiamine-phosphate diphosphorylase